MKKLIDYCPICGAKVEFELPKLTKIPEPDEKVGVIGCEKCGTVLLIKAQIRVNYILKA